MMCIDRVFGILSTCLFRNGTQQGDSYSKEALPSHSTKAEHTLPNTLLIEFGEKDVIDLDE